MQKVSLNYTPQPKQMLFHSCAGNEILFGGSAGPGKSMSLRFAGLQWCFLIPGLHVYLFRRTFPEVEDNHILPSLVQFPHNAGKYREQKKRWEWNNGSMLHFCHCQYENDVFRYQGPELHLILVDELTTFTEFIYDYLRSRNRCTLDIPKEYRHKVPGIMAATNPGGVGHEFVKRRWIDFAKPMELKRAPKREGGMLRCFVPALLEDNPILTETNPDYIHKLDAFPEPYRTAYKDGNWDIFIGQAFNFSKYDHVVEPQPIPQYAPLYMTYDWGFGAPFSILWWWVDPDGRLFLFAEWYGWNGTPNQGLRMADSEVAEGIIQREKDMGLWGRDITRLCDPTSFNKQPDPRGGGQGPSTAETFAEMGVDLEPGDAARILKIRAFHERLRVPKDGTRPMLQVYDTCEQFIRTIPLLQMDKHNTEYIDTNGESHCFDSACHIAMARPLTDMPRPVSLSETQKIWDEITGVHKNSGQSGIIFLDEGEESRVQ